MSLSRKIASLAKRPRPFEVAVLMVLVTAVVSLRIVGLRLDWQGARYTFVPFLRAAPMILGMGFVLQLLYKALLSWATGKRWQLVRDYLRSLRNPGWWLMWARLFVAYMLVTYVYFWVKVSVPLLNHSLWDAQVATADRLMHLGLSPNIFAVELVAGTPLPRILDVWYGFWIQTVMAAIAFFAASSHSRLRSSFMLSCVLLWSLGAVFYLAFPTLGPCYTTPEDYAAVAAELPRAARGQAVLWENYELMVAGREGILRQFNPTRGIGALPSLHVAAHVLFALWSARVARPLLLFWCVASTLTLLGCSGDRLALCAGRLHRGPARLRLLPFGAVVGPRA